MNAMRALRDVPIKRKLIIINTVTSGVTLLLACLAFMAYELVVFRESMISDLSTTAAIVGSNSAAALTFDDTASAEQTLRSLQTHPHIVSAAVYGSDDKVFARYRRPGPASAFEPRAPGADGYWFGRDSLELLQRFAVAGEPAGAVYIHSDLRDLRRYPPVAADLHQSLRQRRQVHGSGRGRARREVGRPGCARCAAAF